MEKATEKKKLLLVAISVGVFLVILISASILIFTPKTSGTGTAFSSSRPIAAGTGGTILPERTQPATVDAADLVKNPESVRGIQTPPPSTSSSQETNFYINGEKPNATYTIEKNDGDASAKVTINIPKPSTAAVPDVPPASTPRTSTARAPAPAPAAKPSTAKPTAAQAKPALPSAKPPSTSAKSGTPSTPKPAVVNSIKPAATATPKAAQSKTQSDYWIQTGAFSTQVRAEGAKETLASKGITSIVENRVVDGKIWYRVRVGPYTSENEANYWLALVKSINGFDSSQVRLTPR